ncbi:Uncharacterized protein QTN25_008129 [Entamoeba marina]
MTIPQQRFTQKIIIVAFLIAIPGTLYLHLLKVKQIEEMEGIIEDNSIKFDKVNGEDSIPIDITEDKTEDKTEETIEDLIYEFNKLIDLLPQHNYSISIFPYPGCKLQELPSHEHLTFIKSNYNTNKPNKWWPNSGYYMTNFNIGWWKKGNYSYLQYQEDMAISHLIMSSFTSLKTDFVLIAPPLTKLNEEFAQDLYRLINYNEINNTVCSYALSLSDSDRQILVNEKTLSKVFQPRHKDGNFYTNLYGLMAKTEHFKRLPHFYKNGHFLNSFEQFFQSYCDILNLPIAIPNKNLFSIENGIV